MRITDPFRTSQQDADLDAEVTAHIEHEVAANIANGMSPDEARRQALVAFGGVQQTKESVRDLRPSATWESILQDVRFGARILMKTPVTTVLMLLIFAIGIGGTTALFSVVNRVLLRPLPFSHPEQIVWLTETWRGRNGNVSAGNWNDWRAQAKSVSSISAVEFSSFNVSFGSLPERIAGAAVTPDFFKVFDVAPAAGRLFTDDEAKPGKNGVVVISDAIWRDRFGHSTSAFGKTIEIDRLPYTIIGVMPPRYDPTGSLEQFWIPTAFTPEQLKEHDDHGLYVVGRLNPGVTIEQAQSELDILAARQRELFPKDQKERGIHVESLHASLVKEYRPSLLLMLAATFFLLMIACANIANLQLARSAARHREIAMRASLGATPRRIIRQLLVENVFLSAIGGTLGIAVAYFAAQWLTRRMPGEVPWIAEATLQPSTLLFALAVTLACGILCGIVPALRSRSLFLSSAMSESGNAASGRASRDWVRTTIVVAQTALTLMLLVGAALLIKSANKLNHTDAGFDGTNVIAGRIPLPEAEYKDPIKIRQTFYSILEDVQHIPGVQSAALDSRVPLGGGHSNGLLPEGRDFNAPDSLIQGRYQMVTPEFFSLLKVPLKAGRLFGPQDTTTSQKVMVINETIAKQAWPGQNPIGKRIACCERDSAGTPVWKEVIGVVGDLRSEGIRESASPEFYLPIEQAPPDGWRWVHYSLDLVVRGTNDPMPLANQIRQIVAAKAPGVPFTGVSSMAERVSRSVAQEQFTTRLLTVFSTIALLLASIGIYGVLSYTVSQRSREIAIRMAIGAQRRDVLRMIVTQGMKLTFIGLVIGLAGALLATRLIASLLFQVTPNDPTVLTGVAFLLAAIALLASYLPARRASALDPLVAFRAE
jgi:putative ABC transport system permease protein